MGVDWVRVKISSGADLEELRTMINCVAKDNYHGGMTLTPFKSDALTGDVGNELVQILNDIEAALIFPPKYEDRDKSEDIVRGFSCDGSDFSVEDVYESRVSVFCSNAVFPIEWRDEGYRSFLPDELPAFFRKWRTYIEDVRARFWEEYLHELFLKSNLDDYFRQCCENLVLLSREALTLTNAWCKKEGVAEVRDRILEYDALARFDDLANATPWPKFDLTRRDEKVTAEQTQKENAFLAFRSDVAKQIQDWNFVARKKRIYFPSKQSFEDFSAQANGPLLHRFFLWCEFLIKERYGLYLSA